MDNPTIPFAHNARSNGFLDWLFGTTPSSVPTQSQGVDKRSPQVKVEPPPTDNFWVESFFDALTEATTLFAKRHVELVTQEDPSTVYKVREVKIECKDAPAQFHRDVLSLPALVRNRVVKSRMQKAPGSEYLLLTDFFGSTLAADITLVEGQVVQTLVSYSGSRFVLKFAFEGDYVTRPEAPPGAIAEPVAQARIPTDTTTSADGLAQARPAQHTQLRTKGQVQPGASSEATPLKTHATQPVQVLANLRLRSGDAEVVLPLMENNFPYTIGRHPSFKGYSVSGQNDPLASQVLDAAEPAGFCSFVSREHLVLHSFDASTQQFQVSAGKGKNGTFFKATAMPTHFLLPLLVMAKGDWLKLGGADGDGILDLRIEAV